MSDIESFLEAAKHGSSESKMVEAYMRAKSELENKQSNLVRCIRSKKTSSGLVAVFPSGSEDIVTEVEDAEKALADIREDIKAYLTLTEGQPSISSLTDRLFRARRAIEARCTLERALRETNSSSMEEIEGLPEVQASMDKRDQAQRQLGPVVEDLESRISKIRAILGKYDKITI
jgi:DNA repair ATPase RecN